jgi:hypothetical protein
VDAAQPMPILSMTEQVSLRLNGVVSCGWTRYDSEIGMAALAWQVMCILGKTSCWPSN